MSLFKVALFILFSVMLFVVSSEIDSQDEYLANFENNDNAVNNNADDVSPGDKNKEPGGFYSYTVKDIDGSDVDLAKYRGMVSLVVNVASECGYTDNHYRGLKKLHNHLSSIGPFTVLAFPCNQFGKQEPGTNKEIQQFVDNRYKVKFPVFGKINVIDSNVPPAWQFLISEAGTAPNWNFYKYLVDENGEVLDVWGPWTSVDEIYSTVQEVVAKALKQGHTEL